MTRCARSGPSGGIGRERGKGGKKFWKMGRKIEKVRGEF